MTVAMLGTSPHSEAVLAFGAYGARGLAVKIRQSLPSDGRSRRKPAVADRGLGRLNWADSSPSGTASGRTGVGAIAVIHCERENRLHRPRRTIRLSPVRPN